VAQLFPKYVEEEENERIMAPISKFEVENALKTMQKDKSSGSDGWTVEFFQHFFDLFGEEIVGVVEESRIRGFIHEPFNTTFLAVIPKADSPASFEDFRPISLCNCIYKIIAKTIAIRLKPILLATSQKNSLAFWMAGKFMKLLGWPKNQCTV